jgi:hypothetical protein
VRSLKELEAFTDFSNDHAGAYALARNGDCYDNDHHH